MINDKKTDKMNILFVLENYYPNIGGVEVVFKNLAEGLVKLGHNASVITHQLNGTKKEEKINGVKVYRMPCLNSRYLFSFLAISKTIELAKEADIIHTTTYNGALPAIIAAKLLKKPCVITVHEVLGKNWLRLNNFLGAKLHQFLEKKIISQKFDKFVSVSNATEKNVLKAGVPKKKSIVIYNGVDYDLFDPKKYDDRVKEKFDLKNDFVYMFYGRSGITKGLEYLIKAVPIISQKIPNSKLLAVVSKDKRYKKILRLIKKLKIKDKVILIDAVSREELPYYIKAADCVVVPSLTEGFGFAAAEACAMEKPVVASNVASLPEVVSGKYVLVKPADAEDIAKGIKLIYKGKYKKKSKKRFNLKDNIQRYLKVYQLLKK